MSIFSDVLRNNIDASCILLHGDVTDTVLSGDLCFREFNVALSDILKEHGFDNVVFFDTTNALGKFVYDDRSAYHSIQDAVKAYEKKYGTDHTGGNTEPAAKDNVPESSESTGRVNVFGKPRKKLDGGTPSGGTAGGAGGTADGTSPRTAPAGTVRETGCGGDEIVYQQKNMLENVFYGESQTFMKNVSYRSAIVFTDINNLLQGNSSVKRFAQSILNHYRNNNLIIFIHPDISCSPDDAFIGMLKNNSMLEYFYTEIGTGVYVPNARRVFRINNVGKDEITYLLSYYSLFDCISFPEGIDAAAEKVSYIVNSINSEASSSRKIHMRYLKARMEELLRESGARVFDDAFIEKLLGCNMNDYEFDPWKALKSRHGWEEVTKQLEKMLKSLGTNGEGIASSEYCLRRGLTVERLDGSVSGAYPSCERLPHMLMEGSPGVGKTTIAGQLGRLLHDYGWLSVGNVVRVDKSDLISDHIGGTAIKVHRLLDRAENGVLFIDEAYSLCEDYEKEGNAAVFAKEAVDTLVNAMTDASRHVVIVFAGYRCSSPEAVDGVRGLFKMNQGLASRVKHIISIPDYKPEVLTKIFFSILKEKGYTLGDDLSESDVETYMENVYQSRDRRNFSNGRFVKETLIERRLIANAMERGDARTVRRADFGDEAPKLVRATKESIYAELNTYPGLDVIGKEIIDNYLDFRQMQIDDRVDLDNIDNVEHIILAGGAGSGKTTLANLLCRALGTAHITSGAPPVTVNSPESVTPSELTAKIRDAINFNTMLLIDEAHNCPDHVIHSLLNPMSENKKLTCIFCVYTDRYEEFLKKDEGLKRRTRTYRIEDYTPEQLLKIFVSMAKKDNRGYTDGLLGRLEILFKNRYENRITDNGYGNAGEVKMLMKEMKENCYRRTRDDAVSEADKRTMTEADIPERYREIIASQGGERGIDEILESINSYYGWEDLKSWLVRAKNQVFYKEKINPAHKLIKNHIRFVGAPGTGKTTAGELFAEAAYAMGLIPSRHFRYCTAKDLIAGYVGQSHGKADSVFKEGLNGVLFIDEAYSLDYSDSLGSSGDFKKDVVEGLLAFAENNRDRVIIILAGYEDQIDKMLTSNDGLRSRFPDVIRFPNYGPEDSVKILRGMLEKEYKVTTELESIAVEYFSSLCSRRDYSNGRDIRTVSEGIKSAVIDRIVSNYGTDNNDSVTAADVRAGFEAFMTTK